MSDKTHIEWTDATWNPVTGCSKVSQGCKNCYAERSWKRLSNNPKTVYFGREFTDIRMHPYRLEEPIKWSTPRRIFVNSMSDLFHENVPDDFIDWVMTTIKRCEVLGKGHIFQVLTKRPERMLAYMRQIPVPKNLWLGVSVEDQKTADERIPLLLQTPAAVRWISAEPLLGPISFVGMFANINNVADQTNALEALDWVVAGGESGPDARPMHQNWVRSLRDQCNAAGTAFFFKQWGEWLPSMQGGAPLQTMEINASDNPIRVGKKAAGRLIDGREWNEYPK